MVICSAPGKILWIGGYSVLDRPHVSLVTGVDKRVYAKAEESSDLKFVSKQFGYDFTTTFNEKIECKNDKAKFVCTVAEICLNYLKAKGKATKNFTLTTYSDPAFGIEDKAGLGSSAAVTTATTAAIMALHEYDVTGKDKDLIHKISQYAHSEAQGKIGSGFDIAASAFGAAKYVRYSPTMINKENFPQFLDSDWDYEIQPANLPKDFHAAIANVVGESMSTSEAVKKWKAWKEINPEENKKLFTELNQENASAIDALHKGNNESFKQHFQKGWELTALFGEKIGAAVSTPQLNELIEESLTNGAFACKLPGAGGGDSIAAICLSKADKERLEEFWRHNAIKKVQPLQIGISNEGIRIETHFPG
ncbi:hypothetical protein HUU53_00775 [Candidatus Micrarchaeota archaeon]|nr:hypothetical protein [Candidatus Micrarchaeota archaeon]